MATRQYIGARYVPKFFEGGSSQSAEWLANTQYEALTIVTRNGNSYTSRKPVPANIGAPEENPQDWVSTGIFNEQVEGYRQEVSALSDTVDDVISDIGDIREDIQDIEDSFAEKWLFVGDSYDVYFNDYHWSDICAEAMGLVSGQYYRIAQGGYGLKPSAHPDYTWESLLTEHTEIPNDITHIVFGGGLNDDGVNASTLISAATSLNSYIRTRFTNLKKIYLSYMGMTYSSVNAFIASNDCSNFYSYIASANKWIFTSGVEHTLFDPSLIDDTEDRAHPNRTGVYQLGIRLYESICGGYAKVCVNKAGFATVNSDLGYSGQRAFYTRVIGGDVKIYDNIATFTGSSTALTGFIDLYTFNDKWSLLPYQFYQPVIVKYGSTNLMGVIICNDMNKISLYLDSVSIPANTAFSILNWKLEDCYR